MSSDWSTSFVNPNAGNKYYSFFFYITNYHTGVFLYDHPLLYKSFIFDYFKVPTSRVFNMISIMDTNKTSSFAMAQNCLLFQVINCFCGLCKMKKVMMQLRTQYRNILQYYTKSCSIQVFSTIKTCVLFFRYFTLNCIITF